MNTEDLMERLIAHRALKESSPGFHLSDDDLDLIITRLRSEQKDSVSVRDAAEKFRAAVIESGALTHVSQDKYFTQLRALEAALASPAVGEERETQFDDFRDLDPIIYDAILKLEIFIGDMDGKTLVRESGEGQYYDEGTIDASEGVTLLNRLARSIRYKCKAPAPRPVPEDVERAAYMALAEDSNCTSEDGTHLHCPTELAVKTLALAGLLTGSAAEMRERCAEKAADYISRMLEGGYKIKAAECADAIRSLDPQEKKL